MIRYRVVAGWYPSRNTAERVLQNIRGKCSDARLIELDGFFSITVSSPCTLAEAVYLRDEARKLKVYCGVEVYDDEP